MYTRTKLDQYKLIRCEGVTAVIAAAPKGQ
jgi:hypothetical protein